MISAIEKNQIKKMINERSFVNNEIEILKEILMIIRYIRIGISKIEESLFISGKQKEVKENILVYVREHYNNILFAIRNIKDYLS